MLILNNADSRKINEQASKALMKALLEAVTIGSSYGDLENVRPSFDGKESAVAMNATASSETAYDPTVVFSLELATALATRDEESMQNLSADVIEYCTEILRQRKHLHPISVQRALTYLLTLKKRGEETVLILLHSC